VKVIIRITKNFKSEVKPLLKKYHSLSNDLLKLEKELIENPRLGAPLGKDTFKIRLKITSKARGKSGGA
jgi:mRNA-degrading endonuclease RelE of RelBE toxin-antitoxin system